jgi:multidrug efflux pump subunit AcrA (membrane-fusion protein)
MAASMPELEFSRIRTREPVAVSVGQTTFTSGVIAEVIPASDVQSRTLVVKVDLPGSPELRTGRYGTARFAVGRTERLDVPRKALTVLGQLEALFVVDSKDRAHLRLVRTGTVVGDRVEVLSGLEAGESVAISGLDGLCDGCTAQRVP